MALEDIFTDFSRDFSGVTGSLGAVYHATDRMNLRLNASRGFRTPNMSGLACIGTQVKHKGKVVANVSIIGDNLLDKAYQSHLSRLKYADENAVTGRTGVFNMGRNITLKLDIPLRF